MDWYVHLHYPSCALCQEYRELENHGFNMAKGLCVLLKESIIMKVNVNKDEIIMTKSCSAPFTFAGWKGSNKFVGCVQGMKAPVKQAMCF